MMEFPEPLFESHLHQRKICLVCARKYAKTVLRSTDREIVPICEDCSADWNFYGYQILKRIKPGPLVKGLLWFKARHLLGQPTWRTIWRDIRLLKEWAGRMKKWM